VQWMVRSPLVWIISLAGSTQRDVPSHVDGEVAQFPLPLSIALNIAA
jgi:hypothetical protein